MKPKLLHVKNRWPRTELAQCSLFFAQCVFELTNQNSWDGFLAYGRGTFGRLNEVGGIATEVIEKRIRANALKPFKQELLWSLEKDPFLNEKDRDYINLVIKKIKEDIAPRDLRNICSVFIKNYKNDATSFYRARIRQACKEGRKEEIYNLSRYYISHLIDLSFEISYINRCSKEVFFSEDISRCGKGLFDAFFNKFTEEEKEFRVYTHVRKNTKNIVDNLFPGLLQPVEGDPPAKTPKKSDKSIYVSLDWSAKTPESAFAFFSFVLHTARGIPLLKASNSPKVAIPDSFVEERRKGKVVSSTIVTKPDNLVHLKTLTGDSGGHKWGTEIFSKIFIGLDQESKQRFMRSFSSAGDAIEAKVPEVQLVTLWTAFEALLPYGSIETSRIEEAIGMALPPIVNSYIRRRSTETFILFERCYRQETNEALHNIECFSQPEKKFLCLAVLPEFEPTLRKFLKTENLTPLARRHLFALRKEFMFTKSSLKRITEYENMVRWQINRIYLFRNRISHGAQRVPSVEIILSNIIEYYRAVLEEMGNFLSKRNEERYSIDQILYSLSFQKDLLKENLGARPSRRLSKEDIDLLWQSGRKT